MTPEGTDVDSRRTGQPAYPAAILGCRQRRNGADPFGFMRVKRRLAVDPRRLWTRQDYEKARLNVMLVPLAPPMGSYFR